MLDSVEDPRHSSYDLGRYSSENSVRHRPLRVCFGLSAIAVLAAMAYLEILIVANPTGNLAVFERVYFGGLLAALTFMVESLLWLPVRYLGPPPTGLEVGPTCLKFTLANRSTRVVPWSSRDLKLNIYSRRETTNLPESARTRLMVLGANLNRYVPGLPLIPLTYVPEQAADAVVAAAEFAGVDVRRIPNASPISMHPRVGGYAVEIRAPAPPAPGSGV